MEGKQELQALGRAEEFHGQDLLHVSDNVLAFLAAMVPMETWSSLSAEVGMESTLAG